MPSSEPVRRSQANAEVLRWQVRLRVGVVGLLLASWAVFKLLAGAAGASLGERVLGAPLHLVALLGAVTVYLAFVIGQGRWVRGAGQARTPALVAVVTADVLLLFAALWLVASPSTYARNLLLSFLGLQLVQLHFGRVLTGYAVALVAACYLGLVLHARALGVALSLPDELWTVYLYLVAGVGFLLLQGGLTTRLARLVGMFRQVEEGDFSIAYDVAADRRPDHVTAVGRAYNRMRSQLSTIVLTDPLSGCLNRRGFESQLAREVSRASRTGGSVALLALDVDYFKRINDTFGHLAGDEAIREVGQLLRDTARTGDVVARIGGEEFMILAPDTNASGAYQLAQRLVEAFRRHRFAAVQGRLPVTASVGVVAEARVAEGEAEDLRARADEALYAAKRGGRNRVVIWTEGLQPFATAAAAPSRQG